MQASLLGMVYSSPAQTKLYNPYSETAEFASSFTDVTFTFSSFITQN